MRPKPAIPLPQGTTTQKLRQQFFEGLILKTNSKTNLFSKVSPITVNSWITTTIGKSGVNLSIPTKWTGRFICLCRWWMRLCEWTSYGTAISSNLRGRKKIWPVETRWLLFPRESQFESEPVAERAAVAPRGGRVLIASRIYRTPLPTGGGVFVFTIIILIVILLLILADDWD